jgi:hypothetical protein
MTQNNITDIEKCARLIFCDFGKQMIEAGFNPRTNKADLMDLECELIGFSLNSDEHCVYVGALRKHPYVYGEYFQHRHTEKFTDHQTKFAARAEAVIAVAVQIYDAKYGKDGE